jgi:hypothetical protein
MCATEFIKTIDAQELLEYFFAWLSSGQPKLEGIRKIPIGQPRPLLSTHNKPGRGFRLPWKKEGL